MKKVIPLLPILLITSLLFSCISNTGGAIESDDSGIFVPTSDVSEPAQSGPNQTEMPFKPMERPELLADSMPAICDPLVTGDFIQAWYCGSWSERNWTNYFQILGNAGFDFVILQHSSDRKEGKYTHFYYPSKMAEDKEISSNNVSIKKDTIKNMLEAASKSNIKVFIGIGGDDKWWDYSFKNIRWCEQEAGLANQCAKELYDLYKNDYPETFAGWYWTWEMFSSKGKHEINWSKMLNYTLDYLTELDPSMPLLFSPYYSSYEDAPIDRVKEQWSYLAKNTNFREGDIFCPQDNIGIHSKDYGKEAIGAKYDIEFMEQVVRAQWEAAKENENLKFWINVENFNDGKSASISRYIDQIDIASKYGEKIITFSYAHYYSPLNVAPKYNKEYLQYKDFIESNRK